MQDCRGAGAYLLQSLGRRWGRRLTGHQSITMYPERTHACTGRTCKLNAEKPQAGIRTQNLLAESGVNQQLG
ncbi:hypothetical protein ATANTOWER_016357 [Ataeniobius toweri]|uniref:Uncharacterized protein n=1 Tax=Ataeniobius toweri TaxID=208326 RepID=A0ABU7AQV7_9TELE|nr:hypothetical protein [Ataeniobius toweri]